MAGSGVTLYAVSASGNRAVIGTIDWREDVYMPSQINDNVAQIMADIRNMANAIATGWIEAGDGDGTYTATYVSATSFRFDGVNVTTIYPAGARIRVTAPTPVLLFGTITSSVFATHTTLTVAWDAGALSNEPITSVMVSPVSLQNLPPATTTIAGSIEIATQAEVDAGANITAAVIPATLHATPTGRSFRNALRRNAGFEVWQRGAGGAASIPFGASQSGYMADGWVMYTPNAIVDCVQSPTIVNGSRYSLAVQRRPGQPGVGQLTLEYPLDSDEIAALRGNMVTLSFWAQAGANFSPAGGTLSCLVQAGSGSPVKLFVSGYTGAVAVTTGSVNLTGVTTRFQVASQVIVPGNASQGCVAFQWTPTGTAGAGDLLWLDDVQLEIGTVMTPFERVGFENELRGCEAHFWKTFDYATAPATNVGAGSGELYWTAPNAGTASQWSPRFLFPSTMRIAPACLGYNPAAANNQVRNFSISADHTGVIVSGASRRGFRIDSSGLAGTLAGHLLGHHITADAGI